MSTNKTCDCCDLIYDDYVVNTMASGQPGVRFVICEDCEETCPLDQGGSIICNISGRAMKPDVEKALIANGGAGNGPTSQNSGFGQMFQQNANGVFQPTIAGSQQIQQMLGGVPGFAGPKQVHEIPEDAECSKHGGHWGDDETCDNCTDEDGDPKKYRKPKPPPKNLTKSQSAPVDSTIERLRLQLKAGLDDNGRPLKPDDRKRLERQVEIHTEELDEDVEARMLLGVDDADAEMRRLLGWHEPLPGHSAELLPPGRSPRSGLLPLALRRKRPST